jgi:hypothetical protein
VSTGPAAAVSSTYVAASGPRRGSSPALTPEPREHDRELAARDERHAGAHAARDRHAGLARGPPPVAILVSAVTSAMPSATGSTGGSVRGSISSVKKRKNVAATGRAAARGGAHVVGHLAGERHAEQERPDARRHLQPLGAGADEQQRAEHGEQQHLGRRVRHPALNSAPLRSASASTTRRRRHGEQRGQRAAQRRQVEEEHARRWQVRGHRQVLDDEDREHRGVSRLPSQRRSPAPWR